MVFLEPIIKGVSHDPQQPGAAVSAPKPGKKLERAQISLLHDILCVRVIAGQPARQIISGIGVWHDALFKTSEFVLFFGHAASMYSGSFTIRTRNPRILFPTTLP